MEACEKTFYLFKNRIETSALLGIVSRQKFPKIDIQRLKWMTFEHERAPEGKRHIPIVLFSWAKITFGESFNSLKVRQDILF